MSHEVITKCWILKRQNAEQAAEITQLKNVLAAIRARIDIIASDGVWWIDDQTSGGFDLDEINKALKAKP